MLHFKGIFIRAIMELSVFQNVCNHVVYNFQQRYLDAWLPIGQRLRIKTCSRTHYKNNYCNIIIIINLILFYIRFTPRSLDISSSVSIKLKSSLVGRQKLCMKWAQWPLGCTRRLILMNCDTPNGRLCASVSFDCKFCTPCILVAFWTVFFPNSVLLC